jgi:hypothetical protein
MRKYDAEVDPRADEWLATDEGERIAAVEAYHRRQRIRLPSPTLHATIHTVVENHLALGREVVVETLRRLKSEGLTRHEAVHAIGMVLAEQIYGALRGQSEAESGLNEMYLERLKELTARQWRASGDTAE